jgi:hypothetical protein
MISGFKQLLMGVVVFAAVNYLLGTSLFTGTDPGTTILVALLSLIVAMAVLFVALGMFGAKKG